MNTSFITIGDKQFTTAVELRDYLIATLSPQRAQAELNALNASTDKESDVWIGKTSAFADMLMILVNATESQIDG